MDKNNKLKVQLRGLNGSYNGLDYIIEKSEFIIGRHFDCDLVLKDNTISSKHAKLIKTEGIFEIHDLESTNGTLVNKKKVSKQRLRTEDIISFDKFEFRFINPEEVSKTIISDVRDFREPDKTALGTPIMKEKNVDEKQKDQNLTFKIEKDIEKKIEIQNLQKVNKNKQVKRSKTGLFNGLLLAFIMAFVINIGLVFLISLLQIKNFDLSIAWNSFRGILTGFPFLHFHTYWTGVTSFDFLYILSGICIPLGLLLAGLTIQRSIGGNRLRNASIFSIIYVFAGFFAQFSSMNFNIKNWLFIINAQGLGITNPEISLILTIIYFWIVAFIWSFIGVFLSKNK